MSAIPTRDVPPARPAGTLVLTALVFVLAILLLALVVVDFVRDLPKPVPVIHDDPVATRSGQLPAAQVLDEPDEVVRPVKFSIADEPEERLVPLGPVKVDFKDEPTDNGPGGTGVPIDRAPRVRYAENGASHSFGISTTADAGTARDKRLTFSSDGSTNNTVVRLDQVIKAFSGFASGDTALGADRWIGRGVARLEDGIVPTPEAISPSHSTCDLGPVLVHQVLEIVPGQATSHGAGSRRYYDTVLVRWIMHNQDSREHSVGLRLQMDTLIGSNDGVPFTVPGQAGLVDTFADYRGVRVPDFVQALERADLRDPGTVAHLTVKVGAAVEPPDRLLLTRWPGGGNSSWELPVEPIGGDSAVVLYWPDKALRPGGRRVIGFAYGLGSVAYKDKLGLTLGGSFEPGQQFTATAYVENPAPGQTLRLEVPAGLRRRDGAERQVVPPAKPGAPALVTWKVEVERTGTYRIVVHSSTGGSQAKTIAISRPDAAFGKLALDVQGTFEVGKTFDVIAKVEPMAGQKLTLHLPPGLEAVTGVAEQPVPAPAPGTADAQVRWTVKVLRTGKFPVRVVSSTGIAQTKTITLTQPDGVAANFTVVLDGEFAPGKAFDVTARVPTPESAQKLTLQLPDGLELAGGDAEKAVPAGPAPSLRWQVKVLRAGRFSLGVKSSTGITLKKSLVIKAFDRQAGAFTFELAGELRPGNPFEVVARVPEPVADQSLTLKLPATLRLLEGDASQPVPATARPATVRWRVQMLEAGRSPVRIESSTGLIRTKTIVLDTAGTLLGR